MTERLGSIVHTLDVSEPALSRREWELRERVEELEAELAERLERERIRELELVSQRHELEVRFAYNAMLEERVVDHANQIGLLHGHINAAAEHYATERQRVDAEFHALAAELAAEREHLAQARRTIEEVERERDGTQNELAAERSRLSYRMVQRVTSRVKKHRYLSALLRRTARLVRG